MPNPPAQSYSNLVSSAAVKANVILTPADLNSLKTCRPGSELAAWIEGNLVPETLLSDEEVRLSRWDGVGTGEEKGAGIVPVREEELLCAIADLDAESEVLNRRAEALEGQSRVLERRDGTAKARLGGAFVEEMQRRNLAGIQRLEGEVHEAREEVEGLFRASEESVDRAGRRIPSVMTELMNGHDRILEGLAKGDLAEDSEELAKSTNLDTVERLTAMLSRMVAEELQIRLDRTYLESLQESTNHVNGNGTGNEELEDAEGLEQDLKSLYMEIPDVAAMYVAQKYKEPLVRAVQAEERRRREVAAVHSSRVTGLLSDMTVELEKLTERLHAFHSYRCVVQNLREGYDRFQISDKSEVFSPTKVKDKPPQELDPGMESMLRHFGVSPAPSGSFHEAVENKVARLRDNARQSRSDIDRDARKTLEDRKMLVESLLQSIDQDDPESLAKLAALDARIIRLREDVEAVSGIDTSQAVRRQRAFVEKWS